ncbi:spermatogenesis associated 6-like protein isoform X7 [Strix uralensis]
MVGRNITKNRVLHKNNHYGASTSVQKEELSSSFDNCEASNTSVKMIKAPLEQATSEHDSSSLGTDGPEGCLHYPPSQRDSAFHRAASSATSQHLKSPNPVGSPSAFQNTYLILKEISYLSDFVL